MSHNRQISRRLLGTILFLLSMISLVGCGYSRWYYTPLEKSFESNYWSIEFEFSDVGTLKPISEGNDDSDTAYYYFTSLIELDTTRYPRLNFVVKNIRLTFQNSPNSLVLESDRKYSVRDRYNGAKYLAHVVRHAPFRVPKQRPDTITVEQDISVFYRDSGKELTNFHHVVKAVLSEGRYSRLIEILEGT